MSSVNPNRSFTFIFNGKRGFAMAQAISKSGPQNAGYEINLKWKRKKKNPS